MLKCVHTQTISLLKLYYFYYFSLKPPSRVQKSQIILRCCTVEAQHGRDTNSYTIIEDARHYGSQIQRYLDSNFLGTLKGLIGGWENKMALQMRKRIMSFSFRRELNWWIAHQLH